MSIEQFKRIVSEAPAGGETPYSPLKLGTALDGSPVVVTDNQGPGSHKLTVTADTGAVVIAIYETGGATGKWVKFHPAGALDVAWLLIKAAFRSSRKGRRWWAA